MKTASNGIASCVCVLLLVMPQHEARADEDAALRETVTMEYVVGLVNRHCGSCHGVPSPSLMPKKDWPAVIDAMIGLSGERTGQSLISAEDARHIKAYYYGSSPETLAALPYFGESSPSFRTSELGQKSSLPLVINVRAADLERGGTTEFLVCDGETNRVLLLSENDEGWQETVLAEVQVPSRTEVVDYDADGDKDIIVAALGILPPSDELAGKVLLLRQSAPGQFDEEVLLEGVGRITDARAVDVDSDDDLDIVVAVFGGGTVGGVLWLENLGAGRHARHELLNISGALNVSPADLDSDGRTDLVSLIAQEHEMLVAFMNRGNGDFERVLITRAPHPMYGSTGMRLVDLDLDGDVDMLFTNGDAFDTQPDPKPYHGVQWLENEGGLQFRFHDIGRFYGAATAIAGDLDADGDLDIIAGSWVNYWDDERRQSLIWFENDGQQNFSRRNVLNRPPGIVTLALQDVTGDDLPDVVAGVLRMDRLMDSLDNKDNDEARQDSSETRLLLLENSIVRTRRPPE